MARTGGRRRQRGPVHLVAWTGSRSSSSTPTIGSARRRGLSATSKSACARASGWWRFRDGSVRHRRRAGIPAAHRGFVVRSPAAGNAIVQAVQGLAPWIRASRAKLGDELADEKCEEFQETTSGCLTNRPFLVQSNFSGYEDRAGVLSPAHRNTFIVNFVTAQSASRTLYSSGDLMTPGITDPGTSSGGRHHVTCNPTTWRRGVFWNHRHGFGPGASSGDGRILAKKGKRRATGSTPLVGRRNMCRQPRRRRSLNGGGGFNKILDLGVDDVHWYQMFLNNNGPTQSTGPERSSWHSATTRDGNCDAHLAALRNSGHLLDGGEPSATCPR